MPSASGCSDPTAKRAESREREKKDVALIERCVKLACGSDVGLITPLLKNVTQGTPYEYMPVPSGRRQFYNLRHKFFLHPRPRAKIKECTKGTNLSL